MKIEFPMGILGLSPFIGKRAPRSIEPWTGNTGTVRAAVDATLYLCRFFYANRDIVTPAHLAEAYSAFHSSLVARKFLPVHVFDGPSTWLKRFAHAKRAKAKEQGIERLARLRTQRDETESALLAQLVDAAPPDEFDSQLVALLDETEAALKPRPDAQSEPPLVKQVALQEISAKIDSLASHYERGMSRDFLRQTAELLGHLDFVVAPDEAEQHCAFLARQGAVDLVMTEDIDALVFGAPVCLRGITTLAPTLIRLDVLLDELSLTPAQFVDFCVLCGSDFTPKAPGFGPVKSYAFVVGHASLEALFSPSSLPAKWSLEFQAEFAETARAAREKFLASWAPDASFAKGALGVAHVEKPIDVEDEKHGKEARAREREQ